MKVVSEGGELEVAVEDEAVAAVAAARHLQVLGIDLEQLRRRRERSARLAALSS